MTRLWFPLILAALAFCLLVAYARMECQADAEWDSVCAKVQEQAARPAK